MRVTLAVAPAARTPLAWPHTAPTQREDARRAAGRGVMHSATDGTSDHLGQQSLVALARDAIHREILAGDLAPGERLVEERLTERLGLSRPPLREALRLLEGDGLITMRPRRGAVVAMMDDQDVFEVLTLRTGLESMAIEHGVPVRDPDRLIPVREALERMRQDALSQNRGSLVQNGYAFHASIVDLAGHKRLSAIYRSVQQQILLCMARNLVTRERYYESLVEHVERHRELLEVIEAGDPQEVQEALAIHGERSFAKPPAESGSVEPG